MKWQEVVSNVNIYGLQEAVEGEAYPMVDVPEDSGSNDTENLLNGVVVQLDLTFTNKAWV